MASAVLERTTPTRTDEQRRAALELANEIRFHRAAVKRDIRAGRRRLLDVWEDERLDTMKVVDLLMAQRGVGRVKAYRYLRAIGCSPSKTLGGLSPRQRRELEPFLRGR